MLSLGGEQQGAIRLRTLTKTKENEKKGALLWSLVLQHPGMRLEDTAAPMA